MSPSSSGRTDPRFVRHLLRSEDAFTREDDTADSVFYERPRLVSHLDASALHTVELLVEGLIVEEEPAVLDLMASVDSHLPRSIGPARVVGVGLNEAELAANPDLSERHVHDLNRDPSLPFADDTFDVALNVVSVEYLTDPVRVFREVGRVLRPGGLLLVVFSTRWFPSKVVRVWQDAREEERIGLVEEFFLTAGAFEPTEYFISMGLPRPETDRFFALGVPSDPVFAVFAEKMGGAEGRRSRGVCADPAAVRPNQDLVAERRRSVARTLECPHCLTGLSKWEVPDDPCIDWPNEYLYLCFNDACPFVVGGWRCMWNQGIYGVSYRYLFNPLTGGSTTVAIRGLDDLRPGIVEGDGADRFLRPGTAAAAAFEGLPRVTDYGPGLGGPRA